MKRGRLSAENLESRQWFRLLLQWQGSVMPAILPRVMFCAGFSVVITILYESGINLDLPIDSGLVPSIVLGLLLVFRTNTAYERYWEGRKLWGTLINTVRNIARTIWVTIREDSVKDHQEKIAILRLLVAFAIATKLHLRLEPPNEELVKFMPRQCYEKLQTMNNPPLEIAFWIGDYLQQQYEKNCIDSYQLMTMFKLLDTMVDVLGACERILKTPIPLAYSIHLKQLLLLYCLTLPFQFVDDVKWVTPPIVALISFTVFGIEEIGIEIENPFGYDANDLPLDKICQTMEKNIEDLVTLAPCVRHWKDRMNDFV
ncbi:bestrophin family ion channel [Crocosphaera sp. UHCC 0190]|uniref:bestrophin family protein n=1 Tax=Crocosphaera sp. UHCC 0190 TaxID=3110246 RepID=UPI002B213F89|nr:bestrophin family ion channel [Crocosphaera sp. UHCC 0190]MEA5511875.1 bestrophin family ion channel [Crocosphaera sp. UHCC 0190]